MFLLILWHHLMDWVLEKSWDRDYELPQSWFGEKWVPPIAVSFDFGYGRNRTRWTYSITNSSFFPKTSTQRNCRGGSIHRPCACVMQQHILPQICLSVWRVSNVLLNGFDPRVCKFFWVILNRFNQLGKYCKVKWGYRDMDNFLLVLMKN